MGLAIDKRTRQIEAARSTTSFKRNCPGAGESAGNPPGRESLEADKLEVLGRYEVHLDRKLERMLTILVRLKELRRAASKVPREEG